MRTAIVFAVAALPACMSTVESPITAQWFGAVPSCCAAFIMASGYGLGFFTSIVVITVWKYCRSLCWASSLVICFFGIERSVTRARGIVWARVFRVWCTLGSGVALVMVET